MSAQEHLTRTADKTSVIGVIIAAMGCAACFPALGSLAAALGLGFLSQYEGPFIRYVLPLFAILGLVANLLGGLRHRNWLRMFLGMIGPMLVLAAALLMSLYGTRAEWTLYVGLILMVAVSVWDLVSPPRRRHVENIRVGSVS
ncbi:MAG: mercury transporter MerC [Sphingomonadales bacterium BRH_c42]|nr:MAG: mercury transporter MerC [Sphingomonadales bacterium BRH_c42]